LWDRGQHPRALEVRDANRSLPLHVALSRCVVSLEVVELMVEQDPRSLRQTNGRGLLPLHLAAEHDAKLDGLYYLASKDPLTACRERPCII
jgi:hypothetical protein